VETDVRPLPPEHATLILLFRLVGNSQTKVRRMDDWRQIVVGLSQHTWRRHDASDNRQPEGSM